MKKRFALGIFLFSALFALSACGGGGGGGGGALGLSATLVSLSVTPPIPSIANGTTQQFTATAIFSDNTTRNMTSSVSWTTTDANKATISNSGMATGSGVGQVSIKASLGSISGSATLNVTNAVLVSLAVTPPNPSMAKGLTKQFKATGTFTDSTTQDLTSSATWTSSNDSIASMSTGTQGLATSVAPGTISITATATVQTISKSASTNLMVTNAALLSIAVAPLSPSIPKGLTQQFTATGTYTDGTKPDLTSLVTWTSSDDSIASVNAQGLAASVAPGGPITITATYPNTSISGTASLTVTNAALVSIAVSPSSASIIERLTQQFSATGTYTDGTTPDLTSSVTWTSSSDSIAPISNANGSQGLATSVAAGGPITITAIYPNTSISGTASLTATNAALVSLAITPTSPSIAKGSTQQFTATGTFNNNMTQDITSSVTWTSSSDSIAPISNANGSQGLATSVAAGGPITITATDPATNKSASANLTVIQSGESAWSQTSDPTGYGAIAYAVAADANYLYAAGYDTVSGGYKEWRIEKRSLADGALVKALTDPTTSKLDYIAGMAIDSASLYAVGIDVNDGWKIEKRNLSNGLLDGTFGGAAAVYSVPSLSFDYAFAVARDTTYLYIAGYSTDENDNNEMWKIEKRRLDNGLPDSGFGTAGVVSSPSGSSNAALALAIDSANNAMYVAGYDDASWRIEKRSLVTGALDAAFGAGGVVNAINGTSANAIATDGTYVYIAGDDFSSGTTSPLIEKRDAVDGHLVSSIAEVPDFGNDSFNAITLDPPYFYVAGYSFMGSSGDYDLRIEKRLMDNTLALDAAFNPSGTTPGVLTLAPSGGDDRAWVVVADPVNPYIYVAGYDSIPGYTEWRIEKLMK